MAANPLIATAAHATAHRAHPLPAFSGAACPPCRARLTQTAATLLAAMAATLAFPPSPATAEESLAERRQRVEQLPAEEQQQLLRNQQRFEELPAAEQHRLRTLHEQLSADPRADHLHDLLERYHEWLKTLSAEQRAELQDLPVDARIARIGEIMAHQRQERERGRHRFLGNRPPLSRDDVRQVSRWFGDLVWQHREELLKEAAPERREQFERMEPAMQRRNLTWLALQNWRDQSVPAEPAQLEALLRELSAEAQSRYAQADSAEGKDRVLRDWLVQAMMSRNNQFSTRRGMFVSPEVLQKFFDHDLSQEERDRLLNMPKVEMQEELRNLYLQRVRVPDRNRRERGRRPGEEGRPERGPGGPGGPDWGRPGPPRPPREGGGPDRREFRHAPGRPEDEEPPRPSDVTLELERENRAKQEAGGEERSDGSEGAERESSE